MGFENFDAKKVESAFLENFTEMFESLTTRYMF